jgi:choline kinase
MKAIILAAGIGKRLYPLTKEMPKCLLTVGDKSILEHQIESLRRCDIHDIVVVSGFKKDLVRQIAGPSIKYIHNDQYDRTNSLYSLWLAREEAQDGFICLNSDVFFPHSLIERLLQCPYPDVLMVDLNQEMGDEEMKVKIKERAVVAINKEMDNAEADGENVGVLKFSASGAKVLFGLIDSIISRGTVNVMVPYAFHRIAQFHPLYVEYTNGIPWIEIDFPEDLLKARDVIYPRVQALACRPVS